MARAISERLFTSYRRYMSARVNTMNGDVLFQGIIITFEIRRAARSINAECLVITCHILVMPIRRCAKEMRARLCPLNTM